MLRKGNSRREGKRWKTEKRRSKESKIKIKKEVGRRMRLRKRKQGKKSD